MTETQTGKITLKLEGAFPISKPGPIGQGGESDDPVSMLYAAAEILAGCDNDQRSTAVDLDGSWEPEQDRDMIAKRGRVETVKRLLKMAIDSANREVARLDKALLEDVLPGMGSNQVASGGYTFYLKAHNNAKVVQADVVREWFLTNNPAKVSVYAATIKSFVRECIESGEGLPAELADAIKVEEGFSLAVRSQG